MDKVEKFKELQSTLNIIVYDKIRLEKNTIDVGELISLDIQFNKIEKELLKMYEEKQEKPVIRCKELYVNMNPKYGYEIQFINLKNHEVKTYKGTLSCKEKDGMLITDDFIFVKTD